MLKRTLYFGQSGYLHLRLAQLVFTPKTETGEESAERLFPVEDVGFLILDSPRLTVTLPVLQHCLANNVAIIACDDRHRPAGLFLNLDGNTLQQELFETQTAAPLPLKKRLWKQTVEAKILNQARLLEKVGQRADRLHALANEVRSGDPDNRESAAATIYWKRLFGAIPNFTRNSDGAFPNCVLNYGYTILRAATARALAGSGLLCTLGIHHGNRYNPFCLADDIMEPYRPWVDEVAFGITQRLGPVLPNELTREMKTELLSLLTCDTEIGEVRRPLMLALSQSSASLARCFTNQEERIDYPRFA